MAFAAAAESKRRSHPQRIALGLFDGRWAEPGSIFSVRLPSDCRMETRFQFFSKIINRFLLRRAMAYWITHPPVFSVGHPVEVAHRVRSCEITRYDFHRIALFAGADNHMLFGHTVAFSRSLNGPWLGDGLVIQNPQAGRTTSSRNRYGQEIRRCGEK